MSQKVKSAAGDVSIVTVDPRKTATSEVSKRLQELEERIRNNYKGVIVDFANKPGTQIMHQNTYQSLPVEFERMIEELSQQVSCCVDTIIFQPIGIDQLINDPLPENEYKKGNFINQSILQYRCYKTDAKLVRSVLEAANFTYTDNHL